MMDLNMQLNLPDMGLESGFEQQSGDLQYTRLPIRQSSFSNICAVSSMFNKQ